MQHNGHMHSGHTKNYTSKMEDSQWELSSNQNITALICLLFDRDQHLSFILSFVSFVYVEDEWSHKDTVG